MRLLVITCLAGGSKPPAEKSEDHLRGLLKLHLFSTREGGFGFLQQGILMPC